MTMVAEKEDILGPIAYQESYHLCSSDVQTASKIKLSP